MFGMALALICLKRSSATRSPGFLSLRGRCVREWAGHFIVWEKYAMVGEAVHFWGSANKTAPAPLGGGWLAYISNANRIFSPRRVCFLCHIEPRWYHQRRHGSE